MARRHSQTRRTAGGFHESPAFAPVLAFIAAVIVAVSSVGSNWYLDHRAEQRDERRALEDQRRALEARIRDYQQAKRLVDYELLVIRADFGTVLQARAVPSTLPRNPPQEVFLPSTAWQQYSEVLAAEITDQLWTRVASVYRFARSVRFEIIHWKRGKPLKPGRLQDLPLWMHEIEDIHTTWPTSTSIASATCFPDCPEVLIPP
jgi:hypothetical protein